MLATLRMKIIILMNRFIFYMTYNININESAQKKIIVEALKTMIRNNNPEPQATYLCNQLDDASCIADCLEELYKQIRQRPYDGL